MGGCANALAISRGFQVARVVDRVIGFIRRGPEQLPDLAANPVGSEGAWLERDLFLREGRRRRIFPLQLPASIPDTH